MEIKYAENAVGYVKRIGTLGLHTTMRGQQVLQGCCAAGVDAGNGNIFFLCFLGGTDYHFMGSGIGK